MGEMLGVTHVGFALLCSALLKLRLSFSESIGLALFSILPDVDSPRSLLGKIFRPLSYKLLEHTMHRGATHSLLFLCMLLCLLWLFLPNCCGLAALGLFSHLFLDMLTPAGLELLWPLKLRFTIFEAPISVGSKADHFISLSSLIVFLYSRLSTA